MTANLSAEEAARLAAFLEPPRIAVVATIGRTGMPQLTPNWYRYADGRLTISTTKERVKYSNLARDNRMAVCIFSDTMAHEYAVLRGAVEIRDGDDIWPDTQAIVERYVKPDGVEKRMAALRRENRVILSLMPDRVHFRQM